MKARRELDALVAEKVMGESEFCAEHVDYLGPGTVCGVCRKPVLPPYSLDIAAVWEVACALRGIYGHLLGPWLTIELDATVDIAPPCIVTLKRNGEVLFRKETSTNGVPEAICLAALKAVGAEVPA